MVTGPSPSSQRLTTLQWVVLFVVIPAWVAQLHVAIDWTRETEQFRFWERLDFSHYYLTSWRIISGLRVFCDPFSAQELQQFNFVMDDFRQPTSTPLISLALAPLAIVPPFVAWSIVTILSFSVTVAALLLIIRVTARRSFREQSALLTIVLCSSPSLTLFQFSQIQGFVLGCLALAFVFADKRPVMSGVLIGLAGALKGNVLPLIPFTLVSRRYRMFFAAAFALVVFLVLPQLLDERLSLQEYLRCGVTHVKHFALEFSGNQGVSGVLRSIGYLVLLPLTSFSADDIKHSTYLFGMGVWVASGFVAGLLLRRDLPTMTALSLALAITVVFAPVAWTHYFLLVWPYLITKWRVMSLGEKLIVWFSFPLAPVYVMSDKARTWAEAISNLEASWLVWVPTLIFIVQVGLIAKLDMSRARSDLAQ